MANKSRSAFNICRKDILAKVNQDSVNIFKKYTDSGKVSQSSIIVYTSYFNHFLVYLMEYWNNEYVLSNIVLDNSVDVINGYIEWCKEKLNNNYKVLRTKYLAVSSFYNWCIENEIIDNHPFNKDGIKRITNEEYNQKVSVGLELSEEHIRLIRNAIAKSRKCNVQDQLLFEMCYQSGLPLTTVLQFKISDINFNEYTIKNPSENKKGFDIIQFDAKCYSYLINWIKFRRSSELYDKLEYDELFVMPISNKQPSHPMEQRRAGERIRLFGKLVGLDKLCASQICDARKRILSREIDDVVVTSQLLRY